MAKVPDKLIPLVILEDVPAVTLRPSVATIWLPVTVSLFSRERIEVTVASRGEASFCLRAILPAVSVLPATLAFWVNCKSRPAIEPLETAVVAWALVTFSWFALQAVLAAELFEEVMLVALPLESAFAVSPRTVPVVETPVKEKAVPVASSEVAAISPEETVKSPSVKVTVPVVKVREAVSAPAPATVIRPVPKNPNDGLVTALPKAIAPAPTVLTLI